MTTKQPDIGDLKRSALWASARRFIHRIYHIPGVRRGLRVLAITGGRLNQDDGLAMASHLTLSALMALFPFLIFVGALAGAFGAQDLADQAAELLFQAMPEEVARPIANEVHNVLTAPRAGVITISLVVVFYLASFGVEAVRAALTRAYGSEQSRGFWFLRLQSSGFVVLGAVACLALALLGVLGPLIWTMLQRWFPNLVDFNDSFNLFRYVIVGSLLIAGLTAAHLWLPGRGHWRDLRIWPGIAATLALWWLATSIFAAYLENFADYYSTYAGLASIVTALVYLYIMSLILIFGAELNAAIARTGPRSNRRRIRLKKKMEAPLPPANDD